MAGYGYPATSMTSTSMASSLPTPFPLSSSSPVNSTTSTLHRESTSPLNNPAHANQLEFDSKSSTNTSPTNSTLTTSTPSPSSLYPSSYPAANYNLAAYYNYYNQQQNAFSFS